MSDDPHRKYVPPAADILSRIDEDAAQRELHDALNNPDLDRALAEIHKGPGGEAPPLEAPVRSEGKGPWHEMPQADVPQAQHTAAGHAQPRRARTKRKLPSTVTVLLAALAVTAPAVLVALLKPARIDNAPPRPAAGEAAMVDASAQQPQAPLTPEAGQPSVPERAEQPNPERQTPPPAASASASAKPATAVTAAGAMPPRAPPSSLAAPKPPGTKQPPDPNIPEGYFQ